MEHFQLVAVYPNYIIQNAEVHGKNTLNYFDKITRGTNYTKVK